MNTDDQRLLVAALRYALAHPTDLTPITAARIAHHWPGLTGRVRDAIVEAIEYGLATEHMMISEVEQTWRDLLAWCTTHRDDPLVASAWQPIATAPRSGFGAERRYVLVRGPSGMMGVKNFVVLAYHDAEYRPRDPWRLVDNGALSDFGWEPTEWMEVPE